jgi:hypothetical protein
MAGLSMSPLPPAACGWMGRRRACAPGGAGRPLAVGGRALPGGRARALPGGRPRALPGGLAGREGVFKICEWCVKKTTCVYTASASAELQGLNGGSPHGFMQSQQYSFLMFERGPLPSHS